jgi:hypothetical protein
MGFRKPHGDTSTFPSCILVAKQVALTSRFVAPHTVTVAYQPLFRHFALQKGETTGLTSEEPPFVNGKVNIS